MNQDRRGPSLAGLARWMERCGKPSLMPMTINGVLEIVYHSNPNDYMDCRDLLDYMNTNEPKQFQLRWYVGRIGIINVFGRLGIKTAGEFKGFAEKDLWRAPRAGHTTVKGLVLALASLGIFLEGPSRWSHYLDEIIAEYGVSRGD